MAYFTKPSNNSVRQMLNRLLVFAGTICLIVYFLPRDVKFNYQFDIGRPWMYGQLIASFDFPIYKDDDVVKHEQDSIERAFQPYYQWNKNAGKELAKKLRNDNNEQQFLPANYMQHVETLLNEVYQTGIISAEDKEKLTANGTKGVMIVDGKMARSEQLDKFYTTKEAYSHILSADSAHYTPSVLRRLPLNEYLQPNIVYDQERTENARKQLLNNYSWATGIVQSGQKIVERGEIISPNTYNILESLRRESIKRNEESISQRWLMLAGQFLFVTVFIVIFFVYLFLYRKEYLREQKSLRLMLTLMVSFCLITSLMIKNNFFNINILPYAMLPIILRTFLDSRTAFMTHLTTILICSISLRYPHEFILLQAAAGMIAIYSMRELSQRSQIFRAAIYVVLTYVVVYFAFALVTENDLSKINLHMFNYFLISGIFLLFTYPLFFLIEKVFGFTSNVTLVELSDINNNLLRRMSETAPGTFQHSMQVANLAAEAANQVGANSQLVRTGALYHDIGKMENAAFFTENQSGGVDPHKSLSYEQSAKIVIGHVTDGVKLAEKSNLPKVIKEFILTHHGRGKTKFFYISWKNEHPNEEPDEAMFTYPGPNPSTKEQAILMMADAVEAASRSLKEYTEESIGDLVERIIDSQMAEGYFRECPITFKDIAIIKSVFKEKLKTIYHTRISYPELKQG